MLNMLLAVIRTIISELVDLLLRRVCCHGVTETEEGCREKIVGIILTTLAALLCTAIDYFLNQED